MDSLERIDKTTLRDVLAKGWLTHDAMWFVNCVQRLGIERANELNLAAIDAMTAFEVDRMKEALGFAEERAESFDELIDFLIDALGLLLPDGMPFSWGIPRPNVFRWEWEPGECFAFKGLSRFGLIDGYECGVMRRIFIWLDRLGATYEVVPRVSGCLMRDTGRCAGEIRVTTPAT